MGRQRNNLQVKGKDGGRKEEGIKKDQRKEKKKEF